MSRFSILEEKEINTLIDLYKALPTINFRASLIRCNPNVSLNDIRENFNIYDSVNILSSSPNLTFSFILKNLDLNWDWTQLSYRSDINSFEDIKSHPELPWNYSYVSFRSDLDINYVKVNLSKAWDWHSISSLQPLNVVQANPDLPWIYSSMNQYLTIEFMYQHPKVNWNINNISVVINPDEFEKDTQNLLDWSDLNYNDKVTAEFILKHRNRVNWDWNVLSRAKLDFDLFIGVHELWNWEIMSSNPSVSSRFVDYYLHKFLEDNGAMLANLCQHNKISFEEAEKLAEKTNKFEALTYHSKLDLNYVLKHKKKFNKKSCLAGLSINKSLNSRDFQILLDNGFKLDFDLLSASEKLSYQFIYRHKYRNWNWPIISSNRFDIDRKQQIVKKMAALYKYRKLKLGLNKMNSYLVNDLSKIIVKYIV